MAADGLDELEQQAAQRRRRNPNPPRNPRPKETAEAKAERLRKEQQAREEARRRREEDERRRREEEERECRGADRPSGETDAEPPADAEPPEESPTGGQRLRPKSIPFYYDESNEEFLWQIAQEAAARREKVPAAAVLRLAMRRLQDQMTPARIVQELGGPSPTTGKRGRPRR
ncbi:hypothetical protein ACWDBD_46940 [Streptomyces sp. NPDC001118]